LGRKWGWAKYITHFLQVHVVYIIGTRETYSIKSIHVIITFKFIELKYIQRDKELTFHAGYNHGYCLNIVIIIVL